MATANQVVARIYGTVAYTDGSSESFGSTFDDNGVFISTLDSSGTDMWKRARNFDATDVNAMLAALQTGHLTITTVAPTKAKTVADFAMAIFGIVSYTDGTSDSFGVEFFKTAGTFALTTNTKTKWSDVAAISSLATKLKTMLETVTGSGTVTIS